MSTSEVLIPTPQDRLVREVNIVRETEHDKSAYYVFAIGPVVDDTQHGRGPLFLRRRIPKKQRAVCFLFVLDYSSKQY